MEVLLFLEAGSYPQAPRGVLPPKVGSTWAQHPKQRKQSSHLLK